MSTFKLSATPPQAEFLALDCDFPAFVGGYGSGKSHTLCTRAVLDALIDPNALIAIYEPSYDLINLVIAPYLINVLDAMDIKYEYNKSRQEINTFGGIMGNFILRSLDAPERIVGYQSFRAHVDELDVLPIKHAEMAWDKITGRNRQNIYDEKGERQGNRVSAYSTPEGYKFMYERWVKNKVPGDGYEMVQAKSETNPFLDKSYVERLKRIYPAKLVAAYLNGEFVNFARGTVYHEYSRSECVSKESIFPGEMLHIGIDFNVTNMSAVVLVKRTSLGDSEPVFHAVAEITKGYDTPELIQTIQTRFPNNQVTVYPDASGKKRNSVGASESDLSLLRKAGFTVKVDKSNPLVTDRVLSVNAAFKQGLIKIDPYNCPEMTACLEQQAYNDKNEPDKKSGHDHLNDALGYFVWQTMPIRKKPVNIATKFFTYLQASGQK